MRGKIEDYLQAIEKVTKPLETRATYYRDQIAAIWKLIDDLFFDEALPQKLTQPAVEGQSVFDFNTVKVEMKKCLVDSKTLIALAQTTPTKSGQPSLVLALDSKVLNDALPIKLQEDGLYTFEPAIPYTPLAQAFMQQFAYALTAYRQCLGLCDAYVAILSSSSDLQTHLSFSSVLQTKIQTESFKGYLDKAKLIKQQHLDGELNLVVLLQLATKTKKEITPLLHAEVVHKGIDIFEEVSETHSTQLVCLLKNGANHLLTGYKEFPNDAYLWMFHDRSFHALLKEISKRLYTTGHTKTSYFGIWSTLDIKKECAEIIQQEITHFTEVTSETIPLLKAEYLSEAKLLLSQTQIAIEQGLAIEGVELVKAPKISMFSSSQASDDVYSLLRAYHQRPSDMPMTNLANSDLANSDLSDSESEEYTP